MNISNITRIGGIFVYVVYTDALDSGINATRAVAHRLVGDNTVHVLNQFPQIFVITAAEIFVSVSCLEFAYSQVHFCGLR